MFPMKSWLLFAVMLFVALPTTGCRDRHFENRDASIGYLESHKQEFEKIAEEWSATTGSNPHSCFCSFDDGKYRWAKSFIKKLGNGYSVETEGNRLLASSLEEAVKLAGAPSYSDLKHWIDLAKQYKLYCISAGIDGSVEIMLAGSHWSPYGFRYAPNSNERSLMRLHHFARQGGIESSDRTMEHVGGRWFYFEATR